jgi:hypothetical protein
LNGLGPLRYRHGDWDVAVPADAPGVTIVARPAGRPGEADAIFSARYGQSTGVVLFVTLMSFALAVVGLRVVGADDRLWLNNMLRSKAAPST